MAKFEASFGREREKPGNTAMIYHTLFTFVEAVENVKMKTLNLREHFLYP